MENQTKITTGAVNNNRDCMDVDLAFYKNTMQSWGIHGNGSINTTQTEEEPGRDSDKRKDKKKFNPFSLKGALLQYKKQEEYKNGEMLNINKNTENREIKKSLMKKLRQSWMCCSKQYF